MLSASFEMRRQLAENSKVELKATLTLADGTSEELAGEDFAMGGMSVTQATSSMGSFDVGAAIVGTCDLTLANYDQGFDDHDFTGATLVPYAGATLEDGTTEWLRKGTYGVEQPDSYGSTISLHCLDNMRLLQQVAYSDVTTAYPATLQTIVRDICSECSITNLDDRFPNYDYEVPERPDDDGLTCLDVIGYVAQVAGCFARCDEWGRLEIAWYDTSAYETEDWLDGGTYLTSDVPYSDGDEADGGGFMDDEDEADGGDFDQPAWAQISQLSSLSVMTDDVVITGVSVTAHNEVNSDGTIGDDGETYLYGTAGYVLSIEDNPFVRYGEAQDVATQVGAMCVGMRFRPFDASGLGSPAWEAGDPIIVTDARQRTYLSWLTSYTWKAGAYATLACTAEAPARNSAAGASALTRAIVEARNAVRVEMSARELALRNLATQLASSSGLYMTTDAQQDGSTIYYMHDKSTLAESTIVWKLTANAFGISTDGGQTYPYGLDVTGTAILNRIYAIGIVADYITSGNIDTNLITAGKIQSANGTVYFDLDNNLLVCNQVAAVESSGNLIVARIANGYIGGDGTSSGGGTAIKGLLVYDSDYAGCGLGIIPGGSSSSIPTIYAADNGMRVRARTNSGYDSGVAGMAITDGGYTVIHGQISASAANSESSLLTSTARSNLGRIVLHPGWVRESSSSSNTYDGLVEVFWDLEAKYYLYSACLEVSNTGYKTKVVDTDDYGRRLLYCYETPAPMFGDVGSGTIGDDGLCYVEIDDVFSETVRTDLAYQVFLQKLGPGDLWVAEKAPTHFVVEGTPGLAFDWELKARQLGWETERLDDRERMHDAIRPEDPSGFVELQYEDEETLIDMFESMYDAELASCS